MKPRFSNKRFTDKRFGRLFSDEERRLLYKFTRTVWVTQEPMPDELQQHFNLCADRVRKAIGKDAHNAFVYWTITSNAVWGRTHVQL